MELRNYIWLFLAVILAAGCKKKEAPGGTGAPGGFATQVVGLPVKAEAILESVSLVGNVMANESVDLTAETEGIVREIRFQEGQPVQKGEALVYLDDTKLAPQLAEAEAQLELSRTSYERVKQLRQEKLISQQEYDTASAAFTANQATVDLKRRQLKDARILAPFSGITGARQISPGQVITRSTRLTQLVDLETVKVEVAVPERYLSQLKTGQQVEFRVAAFPKEVFKGEIYFISPQLDLGMRTALVKARISNPEHKLRGGMFANLELTFELKDSALVIPEPALINNGDTTLVFVVSPTNTAIMKPVITGLRLAGKVEIVKGLAPGETVIVEGLQKLRPGGAVRMNTNALAPYLK